MSDTKFKVGSKVQTHDKAPFFYREGRQKGVVVGIKVREYGRILNIHWEYGVTSTIFEGYVEKVNNHLKLVV